MKRMNSHSLLMSAPMVRALLAKTKTQTRRLPNSTNVLVNGRRDRALLARLDFSSKQVFVDRGRSPAGNPGPYLHVPEKEKTDITHRVYPVYQPGDEVWIKETHYWDRFDPFPKTKPEDFPMDFYYRADGECCEQIPECECGSVGKPHWRPSIFMPRWASRLQRVVKRCWFERLQAITAADAVAEGIEGRWHPDDPRCWTWKDYDRSKRFGKNIFHYGSSVTPQSAYRGLWESINGEDSWEKNPWVLCLEFEK